MQDDSGQYSQWPVATMSPPPQLMENNLPPPGAPEPGGAGWRLAALVAVVVAVVVALAGTQATALAVTRTAAYPHPAVNISVAGSSPYRAGTAVQFTVNTTAGRDLTYAWQFGDEQEAEGATAAHAYSDYGTYNVSVTATDPIGQSTTAEQSINVWPLPPTACFNATADAQDPFDYTFDASCSTGTQLSYSWNYGDGSGGNDGAQTSHEYSQVGTYSVTLTVSDVVNQTATSQPASVTVTIPAPHAAFTYRINSNDGYYTDVTFDASGSTGYDLSYSWVFTGSSEGSYSGYDSQTEAVGLSDGERWTIQLTVTDGLGQTSSTSQAINT